MHVRNFERESNSSLVARNARAERRVVYVDANQAVDAPQAFLSARGGPILGSVPKNTCKGLASLGSEGKSSDSPGDCVWPLSRPPSLSCSPPLLLTLSLSSSGPLSGMHATYEALGQLGQDEPASGRRWNHCRLRPHTPLKPPSLWPRGHAHIPRVPSRLTQGYLAHKKPPPPGTLP